MSFQDSIHCAVRAPYSATRGPLQFKRTATAPVYGRTLFNMTFVDVFIVLFAVVLHDFPIAAELEGSDVFPRAGVGAPVCDRDIVCHLGCIRAMEMLHHMHRACVRMPFGI